MPQKGVAYVKNFAKLLKGLPPILPLDNTDFTNLQSSCVYIHYNQG